MTDTIRIAMWSGPRNISTAMMRAWENRPDCAVMDEPFYGAYLAETGLDHPMRDQILASMPTGWAPAARECAMANGAALVFQKHMCQHMVPAAPREWMGECRHAFLIRPPERVAASFGIKYPDMTAEDLGFRLQAELFDRVCQSTGEVPPVVESADVLAAPEAMLRLLCQRLGVDFRTEMLSWPPGRRDSDGVWAAHWYGAVEQSTGFAKPAAETAPELPEEWLAIAEAARPYYEQMRRHRLVAEEA